MKMTSSALFGLLALLPYAVVSDEHLQFQGLRTPPSEQEEIKQVGTNDAYATAEDACAFEAQTVCACGSTLPNMFPDFMEFTFDMIDPTPMIIIDNLFQSMLPDIISTELNDENQELNGFSSQPHHRRLEEVNAATEPKYLFGCPHIHSCLLQANEQQGQVISQAQEFSDGFFFTSSSMSLLTDQCSHALTGLKILLSEKSVTEEVERSLYEHEHENQELQFMPFSISVMELEPMLSSSAYVVASNTLTTDDDMMVMMVDFLWFLTSILLLCTVLCTLVTKSGGRSRRKEGQSKSERRKLKRSILQQIYADPNLKKQIEAKMGESIGDIPPFPVSSQKGFAKRQLKKRTRRVVMLLVLFTLPFVLLDSQSVKGDDSCCYAALFMVSFVMVLILARAYHRAQYMMNAIENDDCTCCCCGGSASDVENGTVSLTQECCGCCQGTGVCPPACQLCCTDENGNCDDCCGCCGQDKVACVCVDTSNSGTYRAPRLDAAPAVVEGDCCCCNASRDANPELLTVEQIGCLCCGGTGECCDDKGCCCTDDKCCDDTGSCCEPQKEVAFKSSTRIIIDGESIIVV